MAPKKSPFKNAELRQTSPFFQLPLELRLAVYDSLLCRSYVFEVPELTDALKSLPLDVRRRRRSRKMVSILGACQQAYREAKPALYSRSTFIFAELTGFAPSLCNFLPGLNGACWAMVRHVVLDAHLNVPHSRKGQPPGVRTRNSTCEVRMSKLEEWLWDLGPTRLKSGVTRLELCLDQPTLFRDVPWTKQAEDMLWTAILNLPHLRHLELHAEDMIFSGSFMEDLETVMEGRRADFRALQAKAEEQKAEEQQQVKAQPASKGKKRSKGGVGGARKSKRKRA